jgi:hypothetical protein
MASDMEPWVIGGGLLPELQKCIVTTSNIADLFTIKPGSAIPLSAHCYVIELADLANLDKVLL